MIHVADLLSPPFSLHHSRAPSEEFFRLKKIQGKKKRDAESAEQERLARPRDEDGNLLEAEQEETSRDDGLGNGAEGGKVMLEQGKDEDVIF